MKNMILAAALALVAALAVPVAQTELPVTALKVGNEAALSPVAASLPVTLTGKAQNLRCDARLRFNFGGYHNRCPYGRVVTGVQIVGDIAQLTCGEVEVTCR